MRDLVSQATTAATRVPAAIAFTVIGAGVVGGRALVRLVSSLLPSWDAEGPPPRPHSAAVRARVVEAAQVARASGLLSPRDR